MFSGRLFIDGKDAYGEYGAVVVEGGYNELVSYPPLKPVPFNDWHEEDGIEADLSSPMLDNRKADIEFAFLDRTGFANLVADLQRTVYHQFDARSIGRKWTLRVTAHTGLTVVKGDAFLSTFSVVEDEPYDMYKYSPPIGSTIADDGYSIDGRSLSEYGARVLKGSLESVMRVPSVKESLMVDKRQANGVLYDSGDNIRLKSKDVTVHMLISGGDLGYVWTCYDALLHDLIKPGERQLYIDSIGESFPCYYKSSKVVGFYPNSRIWLQFDVTLVFTKFRLGDMAYLLLSDEDGALVVREEDDTAYIQVIRL